MAFQISPGVNVSEVDLTTVVPSVLTTAGAFAGQFSWGPANQVKLIDSEIVLSKTFGTPDSNSAVSFFTAANFLAYGNNLSVVRAVNSNTLNADARAATPNIQVANDEVFEYTYLNTDNANTYGPFMARCAGSLGNGLLVSVCDNATDFATWTYKGYFSTAPGTSSQAGAFGGSADELHIIVIDSAGNFSAVTKSFDIVHPTKENMRLRYGSLEGPENGVYIRGTVESNTISLPDYWTGLVDKDSITVSLTSVGSSQNIYVEKIENNISWLMPALIWLLIFLYLRNQVYPYTIPYTGLTSFYIDRIIVTVLILV